MPMEWEREELELKERGKKQTSQILLEEDVIAPDSKPDISEIIGYHGKVEESSIKTGDEKIIMCGVLVLDILYYSKKGEYGVYAMKATLPFEDIIYIDGLNPEENPKVKAIPKIEHLECQVINDRKLGIKAVLAVDVLTQVLHKVQMIVPKEMEDVEFLQEVVVMEKTVEEKKDCYKIKEELVLDEKLPALGEILRNQVALVEKEIRPMDEKVMIRCHIILDVLYRDDEGLCHVWREKIPFHGYMEGKNITPKVGLDMDLEVKDVKLETRINEDGEARILDVEIDIDGSMEAWETVEKNIVTDAYALGMKTEVMKEQFSYPVAVAEGRNEFHIREKIELSSDDAPMMQVENIWGEVSVEEVVPKKDMATVEGMLTTQILYLSPEDNSPFHIVEKSTPFQQNIELKGVMPEDDIEIKANVEEIDFQSFTEKEGEIQGTILLEANAKRKELAETVVDVEVKEQLTEQGRKPGAIIYTVQHGDSLWSIAKAHETTVDEILMINEIENPEKIYEGQKILIIHMKP